MYDITLADYPRLDGEGDDSARIMRAIRDAANAVLYIPRGEYEIASPVYIGNFCSLMLHSGAHLKAVAEGKVRY